jgi:hypothetical protein
MQQAVETSITAAISSGWKWSGLAHAENNCGKFSTSQVSYFERVNLLEMWFCTLHIKTLYAFAWSKWRKPLEHITMVSLSGFELDTSQVQINHYWSQFAILDGIILERNIIPVCRMKLEVKHFPSQLYTWQNASPYETCFYTVQC